MAHTFSISLNQFLLNKCSTSSSFSLITIYCNIQIIIGRLSRACCVRECKDKKNGWISKKIKIKKQQCFKTLIIC